MIRVTKRDGVVEPLQVERLRSCLWRVLRLKRRRRVEADDLSRAIVVYLRRDGVTSVSSRALFEMVVRSLRHTNHDAAADALESHHRRRWRARRALVVVDADDRRTPWDRSWLTARIQHRWTVGRGAARAISSHLERELLGRRTTIARQSLLDLIDERVENFGLAPWCLMASAPA